MKFKLNSSPKMEMAEFASREDLDEAAQNKQPYLELHCLLSTL